MRFKAPNSTVEYEIPDSWLVESGMSNFVPRGDSYTCVISENQSQTLLVPLMAILPPPKRTIYVCGMEEHRAKSLLAAYRNGIPLEPIEVHRRAGQPLFEVRDGYHRFMTSVVVGYSHLPIRVVPYSDVALIYADIF